MILHKDDLVRVKDHPDIEREYVGQILRVRYTDGTVVSFVDGTWEYLDRLDTYFELVFEA